jgi:hypothetical protein
LFYRSAGNKFSLTRPNDQVVRRKFGNSGSINKSFGFGFIFGVIKIFPITLNAARDRKQQNENAYYQYWKFRLLFFPIKKSICCHNLFQNDSPIRLHL